MVIKNLYLIRIPQFGFALPSLTTISFHALQLPTHMVIKNLYLMRIARLDRVFPPSTTRLSLIATLHMVIILKDILSSALISPMVISHPPHPLPYGNKEFIPHIRYCGNQTIFYPPSQP